MVGNFNTKSLMPKLAIMMLTDLNNIPADFTQETSLNGKYLKGIQTALTDPDVNIGNASHIHNSDGNHTHPATVPSHTHPGTHSSSTGGNTTGATGGSSEAHVHSMSSSSIALANTTNPDPHTHNAKSNDLEYRTITFYKKTNTVVNMSRKSLPRKMTFFYSKTGTLPEGLLANLNYNDKHFKGDVIPSTLGGSNLHQHNNQNHNHPTDITDHEHTFSFGSGVGTSVTGSPFLCNFVEEGHGHASGDAGTTNKTSTPIDSGADAGHAHDNLNHEPAFKTLRLMEVNSVKMSNAGVPKNCIFLWLDLISLLVAGWQVSDGTNNTIDMLAKYPKGNTTPGTPGGNNTHTHSSDVVSHSHTGASIAHDHDPIGSSDNSGPGTRTCNSVGSKTMGNHAHTVSTVTAQASQTITITNAASNHTHGSKNSEPEAKTIAFIERNNL